MLRSNGLSPTWSSATDFNTDYSYDLNGNILNLNRQRSGTSIDQLTYNYPFNTGMGYKLTDQSTNKLEFIDDAVTGNTDDIADQMSTNYQYDASGNLFRDNSEGINGASGIQWTVDGKVRSVDYLGGDPSRIEIEYLYDASGNRVMKRVDREEDSGGENPHIAKVHYDLYARDANSQVMAIYKRGVTHEEDEQDPTITDCLKLKFKPVFVVHGCTVELTICKDNMTFMPDGRSFKFNQPIDYTFPTTSPCAGCRFIIPANTVINYNPKNKSANGFFAGVWGYGMALNIDLPINIFGGGTETVSATLESVITISNISLMPKLAEWHIYGNDQQGRFVTRKPEAEPLYYLDNLTNDVKNKNFFRILDKKEYELKDHLGNVRVAIGDMKLPADPTATYPARGAGPFFVDEKAINDYYPLGMTIADRSWSTGNYRYGYNGKENDNEVKGTANSIDYGARIYDPRVARFLSTDPLQRQFVNHSPYLYAGDSPITFVDNNGENAKHYMRVMKSDGTYIVKPIVGNYSQYYHKYIYDKKDKANGNNDIYIVHDSKGISKMFLNEFEASLANGHYGPTDIVKHGLEVNDFDFISKGYSIWNGPGQFKMRNFKAYTDMDETEGRDWMKYQFQINEIGGRVEYKYNGIDYDGYRDGVFLEAKANYQWLFASRITTKEKVYPKMVAQFQRQLAALPKDAKLEWHFAEKETMIDFIKALKKEGVSIPDNVEIIHTPQKKEKSNGQIN